ncbi:hypothetical protein [Sphingobium boeckii]|uniref:Uncharacterized protein n=1 Tax=Sphingobium boeckii TaxID=1082345 RepID=A0A7W9EFN5_9SPHN|nr:hypothetical protein [Sphingobium boeckii]MBB5687289.1 hypothetical protein [Sphingobium boeckii]
MAGEAIAIAAGETKEFGDEGVDALVAGPFVRATRVAVSAWHRGGDKSNVNNTAWLRLNLDGGLFASADDKIFDNYNLSIERVVDLPALASVSLAIEYGNTSCTKTHSGLKFRATGL